MNIVLIGFMGSGKTEVGKALAARTGRRFIDTDDGITEIFTTDGEDAFRRREKRAVAEASTKSNVVIATGGGSMLDAANVRALKRGGVLVYLKTGQREIDRRLRGANDRPLLGSVTLEQRVPGYEAAADVTVSTNGSSPNQIAVEIAKRLEKVQRVKVALDPAYTVVIGRGVLGRAAELVRLPKTAENAVIVSHPRVRKLWGAALEAGIDLNVSWATFPAGEQNKTLEVAAQLSKTFAKAGLHRGDVVFAIGGGVVGDVGAYVASTYARGISVVQVPTTLLAMVDSAIGGKTGVNLPQGKNLVGTFHQPIGVLADLDVLSTLPQREIRSAHAEVIKYGFIKDPWLLRSHALDEVVVRCAKIKAEVVAADEKDDGVRAILNYGHTFGHAIESLSLGTLHHGEAIAIGMVYAAAVARLKGLSDLVEVHRSVLSSVGLPTRVEGMSWARVRSRMKLDKKYSKGLRFVLLEEPGKPVLSRVSDAVLEAAFTEVTG